MGICVSCRCHERKAPEKRSVPGAGGPVKGAAAELLPRRVDRLPVMANSMSNIKMTNTIKTIVSKRRRRYTKDGFNLDLAYITDRLIAMGFPAEKLEGVYRNHIDEVYRFLEKMHKDHYKIYNLCSERSYDSSKFHERVERYAFEDHTPPNIEMIQPFCEDVHNWLSTDPRNVVAVHCKAGKGRTGTMVCCYLLYSRQKATADEALKFYGTKRTHDDKGVTIPSQRRYVEYYAWLLRSGLQYVPTKVHIRELVMYPPPFLHAGHAMPELHITQAHPFFKAPMGCSEVRRSEQALHVRLTHCTPLCGDVRVEVYNKHKMKGKEKRKEKFFHFWFNTFFVAAGAEAVAHPPLPDSPNLETFKLTLNKWQLDDAHKDKQHKNYSHDFKVELIVQKMPDSSTFSGHATASRAPSPPSSTASSCSEPDTEPDTHWDSGERHAIPYKRLTGDDTSLLDGSTLSARRLPDYCDDAPILNPIYAPALSACGDKALSGNACNDNALSGNACDDNAYASNAHHDNSYALAVNACDDKAYSLNACDDNAYALNARHDNSYALTGNACDDNAYALAANACDDKVYSLNACDDNAYALAVNACDDNAFTGNACDDNAYAGNACDAATVNRNQRVNSKPSVNPIYRSKDTDPAHYNNIHAISRECRIDPTRSFDYSEEPMEYANDVFSSAPTSARESPVEECKAKRADDKTKPRLSLGDMRASWREFSGKFASDSRRRKDDS